MNRKTRQGPVKSFVRDFVRRKSKAEQRRSEPSLKSFFVELLMFAALVVGYFFLVLAFLPNWLKELFDTNKTKYAGGTGINCHSGCGPGSHLSHSAEGSRIKTRVRIANGFPNLRTTNRWTRAAGACFVR
jgi:hypothetical protein